MDIRRSVAADSRIEESVNLSREEKEVRLFARDSIEASDEHDS